MHIKSLLKELFKKEEPSVQDKKEKIEPDCPKGTVYEPKFKLCVNITIANNTTPSKNIYTTEKICKTCIKLSNVGIYVMPQMNNSSQP